MPTRKDGAAAAGGNEAPIVERDERDPASLRARISDGGGPGSIPAPARGTTGVVPPVAPAPKPVRATRRRATPDRPGPLVPAATADESQARLRELLAGFVDSPEDAVADADDMVARLTRTVVDALEERRRALSAHRAQAGADTEQLRLLVQRYRAAVNALLAL